MSGNGPMGGCSDGCTRVAAVVALWLAVFIVLVGVMACAPQVDDPHSDDRPLTTQVNPCGEPGVCEGS